MFRLRKRGEEVRRFILDNVSNHPKDITIITGKNFNLTRQAVSKHIRNLVQQGVLIAHGKTRKRIYSLHLTKQWEKNYPLGSELEEHIIWRNDIAPNLGELPGNVVDIWHYGFTEMMNNAIDHSEGKFVSVNIDQTAIATKMSIYDDGFGIFKKIQRELHLSDERHSVLELAKGKLTTDPENHTGEGIFFASRMFDDYIILSGTVFFSHKHDDIEDWILESQRSQTGTIIVMTIKNNTSRTTKKIFDNFTSDDDYGFTKTVVPVRLVQYGDEKLISRSQAKRLLVRIDKFKTVLFDFNNVESIGQAFADEIFRVFAKQNPHMVLIPINANKHVMQMINRAMSSS